MHTTLPVILGCVTVPTLLASPWMLSTNESVAPSFCHRNAASPSDPAVVSQSCTPTSTRAYSGGLLLENTPELHSVRVVTMSPGVTWMRASLTWHWNSSAEPTVVFSVRNTLRMKIGTAAMAAMASS